MAKADADADLEGAAAGAAAVATDSSAAVCSKKERGRARESNWSDWRRCVEETKEATERAAASATSASFGIREAYGRLHTLPLSDEEDFTGADAVAAAACADASSLSGAEEEEENGA